MTVSASPRRREPTGKERSLAHLGRPELVLLAVQGPGRKRFGRLARRLDLENLLEDVDIVCKGTGRGEGFGVSTQVRMAVAGRGSKGRPRPGLLTRDRERVARVFVCGGVGKRSSGQSFGARGFTCCRPRLTSEEEVVVVEPAPRDARQACTVAGAVSATALAALARTRRRSFPEGHSHSEHGSCVAKNTQSLGFGLLSAGSL